MAISFAYDYAGRVTQSVQDGRTMAFGYVVDGAPDNFYQQTTYPGATGAADGRVVRAGGPSIA